MEEYYFLILFILNLCSLAVFLGALLFAIRKRKIVFDVF
jgi:hypothetical protein